MKEQLNSISISQVLNNLVLIIILFYIGHIVIRSRFSKKGKHFKSDFEDIVRRKKDLYSGTNQNSVQGRKKQRAQTKISRELEWGDGPLTKLARKITKDLTEIDLTHAQLTAGMKKAESFCLKYPQKDSDGELLGIIVGHALIDFLDQELKKSQSSEQLQTVLLIHLIFNLKHHPALYILTEEGSLREELQSITDAPPGPAQADLSQDLTLNLSKYNEEVKALTPLKKSKDTTKWALELLELSTSGPNDYKNEGLLGKHYKKLAATKHPDRLSEIIGTSKELTRLANENFNDLGLARDHLLKHK